MCRCGPDFQGAPENQARESRNESDKTRMRRPARLAFSYEKQARLHLKRSVVPPCLSNGRIVREEFLPDLFIGAVEGTCEVHALSAQKMVQHKSADRQPGYVESQQDIMCRQGHEDGGEEAYPKDPHKEHNAFTGRHRHGPIFPQFWRAVVCPALQIPISLFRIVRTMGAQDAYFHKTKERDKQNNPQRKYPRRKTDQPNRPHNHQGQAGGKKLNELAQLKMAIEPMAHIAVGATLFFAGFKCLFTIDKHEKIKSFRIHFSAANCPRAITCGQSVRAMNEIREKGNGLKQTQAMGAAFFSQNPDRVVSGSASAPAEGNLSLHFGDLATCLPLRPPFRFAGFALFLRFKQKAGGGFTHPL